MNEIEDIDKRTRQREFSNRFIDLQVKFFIKYNFTPNRISYIGLMLTLTASILLAIYGLYFSLWLSWIIPAILGIAGAMDLFDGEVARRTKNETKSGAFLDSNLDRLSDAIFILGLIYGGLVSYILGYTILFFVMMISYIRSRAENEGINMEGVGFMERADRILFLIFAIIGELIFYFVSSLLLGEPIVISIPFITRVSVSPVFFISIIIFTFTLIYTVLQRLSYAFKTLRNLN